MTELHLPILTHPLKKAPPDYSSSKNHRTSQLRCNGNPNLDIFLGLPSRDFAPLLLRVDQVKLTTAHALLPSAQVLLRFAQALLLSAQDTVAKQKIKSSTLNKGTMLPSMGDQNNPPFPPSVSSSVRSPGH